MVRISDDRPCDLDNGGDAANSGIAGMQGQAAIINFAGAGMPDREGIAVEYRP